MKEGRYIYKERDIRKKRRRKIRMEKEKKILDELDKGRSKNVISKKYKVEKEYIEELIKGNRSKNKEEIEERYEEINNKLEEGKKISEICKEFKIYRVSLTSYLRKKKRNINKRNKLIIGEKKLEEIEKKLKEGIKLSKIYKESEYREKIKYDAFKDRLRCEGLYKTRRDKEIEKKLNKEEIERKLKEGKTYIEISEEVGITVERIAKYCRRNEIYKLNKRAKSKVYERRNDIPSINDNNDNMSNDKLDSRISINNK